MVILGTPDLEQERGNLSLWAAVLAGPLAALTQMLVVLAASRTACAGNGEIALHATSAACLAIVAAGAWLSHRDWRIGGSRWASEHDEGPVSRIRFLSSLGLIGAGLFALLVIAEWIAVFALDPCPR
jgi:hypothetical protein